MLNALLSNAISNKCMVFDVWCMFVQVSCITYMGFFVVVGKQISKANAFALECLCHHSEYKKKKIKIERKTRMNEIP